MYYLIIRNASGQWFFDFAQGGQKTEAA